MFVAVVAVTFGSLLPTLSASPSWAATKPLSPAQGQNGLAWSLALDCSIGEPAWDITVSTDGVYFRETDDRWIKLAAQPVAPKATLRSWKIYHPDGRLGSLALFAEPGNDGLNDRTYTYRFDVTLAAVKLTGGCDRLPDGARPSRVVNVADSQFLTVRAAPTVTGPSVASVGPGTYLWKKQAPDKGVWVPVFARLQGETGTATIASGWVADSYLDRLR